MGLLALIPSRDWFYGAAILGLLIFGVYERQHLINEGAAHEVAALKASSDKLKAETAVKTADLKARATMAEQAYDKEHLLVANQPIDSVRLCLNPHSRIVLSPGAGQVAGNAGAGAGPGGIQQVPAGNSSIAGPDIGGMLDALAKSADQVSATLREFQSR